MRSHDRDDYDGTFWVGIILALLCTILFWFNYTWR